MIQKITSHSFILPTIRRSLLALLMLQALHLISPVEAQPPKRLIAYYRAADQQNMLAYTSNNIPYNRLTHIIHVALQVSAAGDGNVSVLSGDIEPNLIRMAHDSGDVVLVSPAGTAAAFSAVAASSSARVLFAQNLTNFVVTNGYDGVDIDWEQPEAADKTNCTLLMQALRQALPSPHYQLSMAVPAFPGAGGQYDFNALNNVIDFYNVMTYDFHGPWSTHAGHNAPLFANHADPDHTRSIDDAVDGYVNLLAIPRAMINLGLPFYGYEFPVLNLWDPCNCSSTVYARKYGDYIKQRLDQNGWTSHLDPVSMAPYLSANDTPGLITYDDAASISRKVVYALNVRDLGGVFIWEISQDFDGTGQDLLDSAYAASLNVTASDQPAAMRKARSWGLTTSK